MTEFIKKSAIYWLIGFSIILSGIAIFFSFKPIEIKSTECSIILTFVGIIATLIVVGNYAQVMAIRSDFETKIKESETKYIQLHEKATNEINLLKNTIEDQHKIHENNLKNLELRTNGALSRLQASDCRIKKDDLIAYARYVESTKYYNECNDSTLVEANLMIIELIMIYLSIQEIEMIHKAIPNSNIYKLIEEIDNTKYARRISKIKSRLESMPKTKTEREEKEKRIQNLKEKTESTKEHK